MLPLATQICYFVDIFVTVFIETVYQISVIKTAVFLDGTSYSLTGIKSLEEFFILIVTPYMLLSYSIITPTTAHI